MEAARAGEPVLRVRDGHIALYGNSAAFCGARPLSMPGLPVSKAIAANCSFLCGRCVDAVYRL